MWKYYGLECGCKKIGSQKIRLDKTEVSSKIKVL
uniref:Uncharacterized protein n=1 Tax=Arundo donax TaxID=35708 RepID=A0A0A8ZV22_ARUDO